MKQKQKPAEYNPLPERKEINWPEWLAPMALILIPLAFLYPLVFMGKTFPASDTQQWLGTAKALLDYYNSTGNLPLWTPNVFGGMPGYMISLPNPIPGLDSWGLMALGKLLDWRTVYLIFMGMGAYLLARRYTDNAWLAAFAGVAFQLSTYFIIILKVGHNTKFQAIAFIPWMALAFDYLLRSGNWKSALLFSLGLSLQLRANHPQITYYTLLALGIWGLFWLVDEIRSKRSKEAIFTTGWGIAAVLLAVLTIAFPYLVNYEYSKFTIRAGTLASAAAGLSRDYALAWSFDWMESLTFFVADFFGGHSPYYWWQMPFTEGPQYLGACLLALAALTFLSPMKRITLILWVISGVVWLLSMGSNFPLLADFMLNYFPFFNKFRTPSMILVILSVTIPLLAVLGVHGFWELVKNQKDTTVAVKKLYYVGGGVIAAAVLLFVLTSSLDFLRPGETEQYNPQTLAQLKSEREALAVTAIWKFLVFSLASLGLLWLSAMGKMKQSVAAFGLFLLITVDLWSYSNQYLEGLKSKRSYENTFSANKLDRFLKEDTEDFRIYPVGSLYQSTRFNYHHESVGGYHGAKLAVFQNLVDSSLQVGSGPIPFNYGTLKAFGVKYLIIPQAINQPIDRLSPSFIDPDTRYTAMSVSSFGGKAFFVQSVQLLENPVEHVRAMNKPDWDPQTVSFVAAGPDFPSVGFDSSATVTLTEAGNEFFEYEVTTGTTSFLFLSEIWYPAGWEATLDGNETTIYQTNHAFRGVVVPAGTHTLRMEFKPASVPLSLTVAWVGTIGLYGGLFFLAFVTFRKRKDA